MLKKNKNFFMTFTVISVLLFSSQILGNFLPKVGAVVDTSSHNSIIVDGMIENDWTDGNYTVMHNDVTSDWGENWGLNSLYFTLNETGISLGLISNQAGPTDNQFNVFIDVDQGGAGLSDYNLAGIANGQKLKFVSDGFIPDFVLLGTGANNWAAGSAWKIYNFTDNLGSTVDLSATVGYVSALRNDTDFDGSWDYPISVTYEAFIPWAVLYSANLSADTQLRFFAAMISGEPGSTIPTQRTSLGYAEYDSYAAVQVADADGDPQLYATSIGWAGAGSEEINEVNGKLILGIDVEFTSQLWYSNPYSFHDYMNDTQWPILHLIYYNSTSGINSTEMTINMWHQTGQYGGAGDGCDLYKYTMPLQPIDGYSENDVFYWYITAGDLTSLTATHHEISVAPIPPIGIDFVGNVIPNKGFEDPETVFEVSVDVEQLWNCTEGDRIQTDVGTNVTLNWTSNVGIGWNQTIMPWKEAAGLNARFATNIGPFTDGDIIIFNIIVKNNNTVKTINYTISILILPSEEQVYYQTDPSGDEYGIYPMSDAFKDANGNVVDGLFDILSLNVSSNPFTTTFTFKMRNTTDPGWGASYWSHLIFAVLINNGSEIGSHEGIGKTYITTKGVWQYGVQVDGWTAKYFTPDTITEPEIQTSITHDEKLNFTTQEYSFSFSVPATLFGSSANENWTYYAMIGSGDMNEFRDHKVVAEDWRFGGGSDSDNDPNVCDIMVPQGGDDALVQNIILNSYNDSSNKRAEMLAIGPGQIIIPDNSSPSVWFNSPNQNDTITQSSHFEISWTAFDDLTGIFSGLKVVQFYIDGTLIGLFSENNKTAIIDLLPYETGWHILQLIAIDLYGNSASVMIDVNFESNNSLMITLNSPEEGSILLSDTMINLTITGTPGTYIYNWDNGENQTLSLTEMPFTPILDGTHILNIFVSDSLGNSIETSYSFTIQNPLIQISLISPEMNSILKFGTQVNLNFSETPSKIFYSWNGGDNSTELSTIPAIEGQYILDVYAQSIHGSWNHAQFNWTVDLNDAPSVELIYPIGGEMISESMTITWQGSDPDNDVLIYDLYFSSDLEYGWTNIASGLTKESYTWNISSLPAGTYFVKVVVSDGYAQNEDAITVPITIESDTITTNSTDSNSSNPFGDFNIPGYSLEIFTGFVILGIGFIIFRRKRSFNQKI
ncbi:MAG: glucodextranase DOMON-like domain-containing protein [Promethearchaeota archaeon]